MLYGPTLFKNREEAGEKLGEKMKSMSLMRPIVLAIPSGGVPVGYKLAEVLRAPLDVIIAKKIEFPDDPETGFGAVVLNGEVKVSLNRKLLNYSDLTKEEIDSQVEKAIKKIKKREKRFREGRSFPELEDRDVIITDDGLASGHSMFVVAKLIRKYNPHRIIVAVPTTSKSAVELIACQVDKLVSLYVHPANLPFAVASAYEEWHDLSDSEVLRYLKEKKQPAATCKRIKINRR
ncbi:phosphoribosyltransferase [Candidatus Dojkabacteria bacterium]|nr:phosphoribosyltransferase [Candidatus Dojkabacteria bacterium]